MFLNFLWFRLDSIKLDIFWLNLLVLTKIKNIRKVTFDPEKIYFYKLACLFVERARDNKRFFFSLLFQ